MKEEKKIFGERRRQLILQWLKESEAPLTGLSWQRKRTSAAK
ncbi:hypothetical protein LR69_00238 [Geobacillus sp. BCO2]|nr:hypothetical protein LR69_00238 [Geobacillus sp. BCO2]